MNEILGILVSRATVKMFLPCQSKLIISKLCIRGSFSTLLLVLWQKESISAVCFLGNGCSILHGQLLSELGKHVIHA
jgi:hypothetical protein